MATNEIQTGRFNALLFKLLDMKEGAPSPVLASEIFPMLALEVDRPEWSFLKGERLCAGQRNDAAVVGQFSHILLRNPTGSGILIVVTQVGLGVGAAQNYYVGMRAQGTVDASAPGGIIDTRHWGGVGSTATAGLLADRTEVTGLGNPLLAYVPTAATEFRAYYAPIVLSPGNELVVRPASVNQSVTASFVWRERRLEDSESR